MYIYKYIYMNVFMYVIQYYSGRAGELVDYGHG